MEGGIQNSTRKGHEWPDQASSQYPTLKLVFYDGTDVPCNPDYPYYIAITLYYFNLCCLFNNNTKQDFSENNLLPINFYPRKMLVQPVVST